LFILNAVFIEYYFMHCIFILFKLFLRFVEFAVFFGFFPCLGQTFLFSDQESLLSPSQSDSFFIFLLIKSGIRKSKNMPKGNSAK